MSAQHVLSTLRHAALPVLILAGAALATAQSAVVDVKIHSAGLEHNLLGDPADQPVSIVLPAAYAHDSDRHFPVLYFLHGFSDPTPRHSAAGVSHTLEIFQGDHIDHLSERVTDHLIPWTSKQLYSNDMQRGTSTVH